MIRKVIIISIVFLLILVNLIYLGSILRDYYSYEEEIISSSNNTTLNNDTISVIFIGDSWASYHSKYDQQLKKCLESKLNKPAKVISRNFVRAKTRFIYLAMHNDSPTGIKNLIEQFPDYAIVFAGINDAVAKMGTENYCHHCRLIIEELIPASIKPIIIDMPQIDYKAIYQRGSIISQIRHRISSCITGAPLWSFGYYRIALRTLISHEDIKHNHIYIPASDGIIKDIWIPAICIIWIMCIFMKKVISFLIHVSHRKSIMISCLPTISNSIHKA